FYAYQRENNSTADTVPVKIGAEPATGNPIVPEPAATSTTSTQTLADAVKQAKKPDASSQRVEATDLAKKDDKAVKSREKIVEQAANVPDVPVRTPPRVIVRSPLPQNTPAQPSLPETYEPDQSRVGPRRRRTGGVAIRNFPDGTQLITSPDGTRVLILPDGSRRVFRPGERIERRKRFR
ncbi:MAG: T-complex 10 C-terminal domain-containing protein, partial [Acidobacteriota bacterium]|nr:T-complex 10 C-terminal domain-containing protein [Acidobacteriota bacterium]